MKKYLILIMLIVLAVACEQGGNMTEKKAADAGVKESDLRVATFAGGCFWCTESDFEKVPGVVKVISGYTGGHTQNPSYDDVSFGTTGHIEAVQVYYDPAKITYSDLLDYFWRHVDPTDPGGQFSDRGAPYRSAIFYHDEEQKILAEQSRKALAQSGKFNKPIVTDILPLTKFYPAEEYHQDYYRKHELKYTFYRKRSGRDQFLRKTWGDEMEKSVPKKKAAFTKPDDATLRKTLTPLQYKVTQEGGTEPAYNNEYWDNKKEGIYVDIVSGEPLFSSIDKYDSETGWPSFTRPLEQNNIVLKDDWSFFIKRTEVRSKQGDAHLGHVFDDGPKPTGLRYCMNSAALRFIPKEDLEKEGYGQYLTLFEKR